jgi:hypothetical protein
MDRLMAKAKKAARAAALALETLAAARKAVTANAHRRRKDVIVDG